MMKKYSKVVLFGFFIWLIPFVVSILIFPIRESQRALFESIMPVVVTVCAVLFSTRYFRKLEAGFLKEGVLLGLVWFIISIVLDLLLFMEGPMKMSFADYMMDIGLTYLIIPIVSFGFGYLLEQHRR
ncbi:MAG: hypothetical protein V3V80_01240 [Dehalococcoidia bacterium]